MSVVVIGVSDASVAVGWHVRVRFGPDGCRRGVVEGMALEYAGKRQGHLLAEGSEIGLVVSFF